MQSRRNVFTKLPKLWVDIYATHGPLIHDPAIAWVYANNGPIRLAEIEQTDPQQVLAQAASIAAARRIL